MFGLILIFALVVISVAYAVKEVLRIRKELECSNIKYSETEADSKCTFEDYKFFELARK